MIHKKSKAPIAADHPGAYPPQVYENPAELALAVRYAPRIFLDQNEPFLPLVVGYTIFRTDGYSPSFPRPFDKLRTPRQNGMAQDGLPAVEGLPRA